MFPTELLLNIFQHLPIYSQRQCMCVCRSWNAAARPFTELGASTRILYGRNCLYRLARSTQTNKHYGRGIRRLELYCSGKTDHFNLKIDLVHILESCCNLAEFVMRMANPEPLVSAMVEKRVRLPRLELILVENKAQLASLGFSFLNLASVYKATLNQLHICVYIGTFSRFLAVDNMAGYLQQFVSLNYLSLDTDCPVVLDSLLRACPLLQRLNLQANPASFQVQKTGDGKDQHDSLLQVLEVDWQLMSEELYMYLALHCKYLGRLILCNPCKKLDAVISTFRAFKEDMSLQIANITFKNAFPVTNQLLRGIGYWFSTVRQVELRGSNLTSLIEQHRNVLLDFHGLNLHYLSIDLGPIFNRSPRILDRVAFELTMDGFTGWWQRDGTAKSRQLFRVRNSKQYLHSSARQRRILSDQTSVMTIKAEAILVLRLHFLELGSHFDQTIMPLNH